VRRVLMRVLFWAYFDGMRRARSCRGWSHRCLNCGCCVCHSGLEYSNTIRRMVDNSGNSARKETMNNSQINGISRRLGINILS
jgi:hypothetical protein